MLRKNLVLEWAISSTRTKLQSGGARILNPASHGTGVIAGGAVRSVLESVEFTMYYLNLKDHQPHSVVNF
jgi:hypothetical protein